MAGPIKSRADDEDDKKPKRKLLDMTPDSSWRNRHMEFNAYFAENHPDKAPTLLKLQDTVYGLALRGAKLPEIAKLLGLEERIVKVVCGDLIEMAKAELSITIKSAQIDAALDAKAHPLSRIYAGKQFAGQVDAPTTVEASAGNNVVTVRVVTNDNPEINQLRQELDAAVAAAEGDGQ